MRNSHPVRNLSRRHQGLTLVELLVAISVLGFVAVLGWRGLDSIVRARVTLSGDLEQTRSMQLTFAQLQSDCAHLASAAMLPERVPLSADSRRLSLVRTVFADNQPTRLQVVSYRIKNGVLTRRESAATRDLLELDNLWRAAASDLDTAQVVELQAGVKAMNMRLWDGSAWRPVSIEAVSALVPAAPMVNVAAPTGLEITLQLQQHESSLRKIFLLGAI